tara:strand:+ start:407 stop:1255 length:849 start_codon:yes stop_codon:yes gene_type:complete
MKEYLIRHLIYIIILINTLIGQFIDFESNVDLRQIRESDRLYFQNTSNDINDFFNINIFGTDIEDLEIEATLHLIIESIIEMDNQKIINAQAIITNRNDIIMTLKSFAFPITQLNDISYNPNNFKNLSSFLEFGAYIIIGNELDIYELNGGNLYYNMATDIASDGKESTYSKGWNERWKKSKEIKENTYLREIKYYFFYVYEDLLNENNKNFKEHLYLMHESIELNNEFIGIDNHTKNFFRAYSKDIAKHYYQIEFKTGLEFLSSYDIDNKNLYQDYINMLP